MGWLEERTTNHGKDGKFCPPGSAVVVTKDGEKYKVVRQHRRMKPKSVGAAKVKRHPRRVKGSVAEATELVHERAAVALARARMRGWVPVREVIRGLV